MILCAGEALIDMLPRETADGEAAFAPFPGGAVFNTAIALGRLGTEVGFFSGLSNDLFGKTLTDALALSHVDFSTAARSDRPTTLAFVTLTNGQAKYAFYDENTAGRMLSDIPQIPDKCDALFFGGISLASEPCGSTYEAMMLQAAKSRLTMIDPNIRPSFISDEAGYRARLSRMLAVADVVKLSDEDLGWLGGSVQDILAKGTALVLNTEGARGVKAHTLEGSFFVPAHKVTVVDTVGAGDTFNAGILAGLDDAGLLSKEALRQAEIEDLRPVVQLGVQAASVTVSRAGANPPWRKELP